MLVLGRAMCSSGLEPDFYRSLLYRSFGLSLKSALGIEFGYCAYCIFLYYCVDGFDGTRLVSAELAAWRVLQIQRALRDGCGNGPCFDGPLGSATSLPTGSGTGAVASVDAAKGQAD